MGYLARMIIGAALVFVAVQGAAADDAWDRCIDNDPDTSISGCTDVLARGNAESDVDRASAQRNRGLSHKLKGDYDSAIADYGKAIVFNPQYAEAYSNRAAVYDIQGEYDLAISDYGQAIALKEDFPDAYNNRGIVYFHKGEYDAAIADYDKAIALKVNYLEAYYNRGLAYADKGDYDSAIADYDKCVEISPNDSETYHHRAIAYINKGDSERGITDYSKAIELNPDDAVIHYNRGLAYADAGELDSAVADFDAAIELEPREGEYYYRRGLAYEQKGDAAKALIDLRVAARLLPEDNSAHGETVAKIAGIETTLAAVAPAANAPEDPGAIANAAIPTNERRVALVIGNGVYQSANALSNPPNDAETIAAALRQSGFSTVTVAHDLDRAGFVEVLRTFAAEAESADWAVVYFAGHGLEMAGTNYLVPVDAKLERDRDVPDEAIALDRVLSAVEGARKLRLVILDACRNNPFVQRMKVSAGGRAIGRGLARVEPTQATLVAYAAKDGNIAFDGDGANSPFATALARHLTEPGVEINKLFRLVRSDVLAATENGQEPFVYGSLPPEDFFFVAPRQ